MRSSLQKLADTLSNRFIIDLKSYYLQCLSKYPYPGSCHHVIEGGRSAPGTFWKEFRLASKL